MTNEGFKEQPLFSISPFSGRIELIVLLAFSNISKQPNDFFDQFWGL